MSAYWAGRLAQSGLIVLLAITVNFVLIHRAPGDPTALLIGPEAAGADPARLRAELGLDRPLGAQYLAYAGGLLRGDLGTSFRYRRPAAEVLLAALPATLLLAGTAWLGALILGTAAGMLAAAHPGTLPDAFIRLGAVAALSVPRFWLGLLLILLFSVRLNWLPAQGWADVRGAAAGLERIGDLLRHLILPWTTLVLGAAGGYALLTRVSVLGVLREDYIRTARAKGAGRGRVLLRHALPNALLPVITLLTARLGALLTGTLLVEVVFAWPGIGWLLYEAARGRDYPVILGGLWLTALLVTAASLLADLAYGWADPRVRAA